jgi:hypothetical protein
VKYLLLINVDEKHYARLSPQDMGQLMGEYEAFRNQLKNSGAHLASQRLRPVASATTVRVRDGETVVSDGPFAETKEQLGGFYMVNVNDLDEAIAWAAKIPGAKHGSIEVRPIWE